jgi:hypothetical protein
MQKLENYLVFIASSECVVQAGIATPENTRVIAKVHPGSSPLVFELLRKNATWVSSNGATLIVESLEDQTLQ